MAYIGKLENPDLEVGYIGKLEDPELEVGYIGMLEDSELGWVVVTNFKTKCVHWEQHFQQTTMIITVLLSRLNLLLGTPTERWDRV